MNKSISSSPIVRVNANDSSRSAGAGCPCRSGKGSGGSPPRYVVKKVLLIVLSLSVFFSLLAVVPSAYNGDMITGIYNQSFGFGVKYNGTTPFGDFMGYNSFHTAPYVSIQDDYYYVDNDIGITYDFEDTSQSTYHIKNTVLHDDVYIENLTFEFAPAYFYNYGASGSNYLVVSDYLFDFEFYIDNIAANSNYTLSMDCYDSTGWVDNYIMRDHVIFDDTHIVDIGSIVLSWVEGHYGDDDFTNNPVSVVVRLDVNNISMTGGDSFTVGPYYDDMYVGDYEEFLSAVVDANYERGVDEGIPIGYPIGYNKGFEDGEKIGYADGYNAGQTSAITADGIGGLLSDAVSGFLDTNIFGTISIGDILLCVCGIALVLIFLKFFAGG